MPPDISGIERSAQPLPAGATITTSPAFRKSNARPPTPRLGAAAPHGNRLEVVPSTKPSSAFAGVRDRIAATRQLP